VRIPRDRLIDNLTNQNVTIRYVTDGARRKAPEFSSADEKEKKAPEKNGLNYLVT